MSQNQGTLHESRVLIIATGGTICMKPTADGLAPTSGFLEDAMSPRHCFNDPTAPRTQILMRQEGKDIMMDSFRTPLTSYSRHIRYGVHEFTPLLDSCSIHSETWLKIAGTIEENYHLFDGFVVLHGTDSVAYTASALSFMLENLGKPVILTGSQSPIFALQNDAVDNLLGSLIIAGTFVIPEVCLYFHHKLMRGNRTTKVSASSYEAFQSSNYEPLAKLTGLGIDVNWGLIQRPSRIAKFSVSRMLDTGHVAILWFFPGILPEMIRSIVHTPNLRGLILVTFGMGSAPGLEDGSLPKVMEEARERNIAVVTVSQCNSGVVSPIYASTNALRRVGVIFGQDLTIEAALTKLAYLLGFPNMTTDDLAREMSRSLRGETTEIAAPGFAHPADPLVTMTSRLTPAEQTFTALGYIIQKGDLLGVRELLEADEGLSLLNVVDYAGNTALHLASVCGNAEIVRELLTRGASVHVRNFAENTPLFLAEKAGRHEVCQLLRNAGAHLWLSDNIEAAASAQ